jgi:hypothetical protein
VSIEPIGAEVVETVVGVVRLLRRAAELAWRQTDAGGSRSSHQLLALGIDSQWTTYPACCFGRPSLMGPRQLRKIQRSRLKNYLLGICGSARSVTFC